MLRRANVDARDRAILVAVWEHWVAHGYGPGYRDLEECTGVPTNIAHWRIRGTRADDGAKHRGGGLIPQCWLTNRAAGTRHRALRPGPRFAGVERVGGEAWPLEWVT